jgi:hypothetical protein
MIDVLSASRIGDIIVSGSSRLSYLAVFPLIYNGLFSFLICDLQSAGEICFAKYTIRKFGWGALIRYCIVF